MKFKIIKKEKYHTKKTRKNKKIICRLIKRIGTSYIIIEILSFVFLVIGLEILKDNIMFGCLCLFLFILQNILFFSFFFKVLKHLRIEEKYLAISKKISDVINM